MKTYTLKELTVGRSKIWEQAEKEEIVITRHGRPYLRIVGVDSSSISPGVELVGESIDMDTGEILEPEKGNLRPRGLAR